MGTASAQICGDRSSGTSRGKGSAFGTEHYDIEDAFKRTTAPSLKLGVTYSPAGNIGSYECHNELNLAIENTSDVTAKMISLQIWDRRGAAFGEDPYVTPIVRQNHFNGKHHFAGPVGFALHPGEQRLFHYFTFSSGDAADGSVRCGTYDLKPGSIRFEYSISAENTRRCEEFTQ